MTVLGKAITFLGRTDGSLHHKALRSGVWVAVSSAGIAVLNFARGIALARLLAPEIFGLMAVCLMATRLIDIFTETGFGAALIHRRERFEEARDTAFTMMFVRGVLLSGLAVLVAPWMARFYDQPMLTSLVAVTGLSFLLTGARNINMVAFQKELDMKRVTYMELVSSAVSFAAAVGLAWWMRSVWALVYGQVLSAAISTALSFLMLPGGIRFRFDVGIAQELYRYGRFMTGLAIVVFLTRELDNALIGKLLGMEALGFYVVAYSLATIPADYLSRFVSRVIFPMFSKLQGDPGALRREYSRGIKVVASVMLPVSVSIAVLAPEIVQALYGPRWAIVAGPLQVLAVFGCFRALWLLNGYLCNAIGKPYVDFYMNLARLVAMCALLLPLTRLYGVIGAALAVTIPMAFQWAVGLFLSRRFIGVPFSATLAPLTAAATQAAVLGLVLIAAKSLVTTEPRIGLVLLGSLAGAVAVALNARAIRTILGVYGTR